MLIDSIQSRCQRVDNNQQIAEIFKEAVEEFDKYGLLPQGISVEEAQRLVAGEHFSPKIRNFFKRALSIQNRISDESEDVINLLCYFSAYTQWAFEINIWSFIATFLDVLYEKYLPLKVLYWLSSLVFDYSLIKTFRLMNQIDIGVGVAHSYFTLGLLGIRKGNYDFHTADGFSGIKIHLDYDQGKAFYFGWAFRVTKK